jgi:hypothetical protein
MASFLHGCGAERLQGAVKGAVIVRTIGRLVAVLLLVLGTSAGPALAGGLDLRLGAYFPSADSNLFADISSLYAPNASYGNATPAGVEKSNWIGFYGGLEYNQKVAKNIELAVSVDWYGKTLDTYYRDFVRDDGTNIRQSLYLRIVPIRLSVRFGPTSRHARVAPFLVGGIDAMVYHYEEYGDFIDFFAPDQPIIADTFISSGVAFGAHAGGGLRFRVGDDFAIVAEGRYFWSKTNAGDDFSLNEIDLGGFALTAGFHVRF